jgi:hypothetical protein
MTNGDRAIIHLTLANVIWLQTEDRDGWISLAIFVFGAVFSIAAILLFIASSIEESPRLKQLASRFRRDA